MTTSTPNGPDPSLNADPEIWSARRLRPPHQDHDEDTKPLKPSDAKPPGAFDRFASAVSAKVTRAWFFAFCLASIVVWAPTIIWFKFDTWQLLINTWTTLVTYLLVALLQNTQFRDTAALHRKLNAIAEGLIDIMEANERDDDTIFADIAELRRAVGLEQKEGT